MPASVRELIRARIGDLEESERNLLDVAACCGFEFDPGLVADALGVERIPALKRLARIEGKHRLVRSSGMRYVFDHHQVHEALDEGLPGLLRQEYHAALARVLEQRDGDAVELCSHLLRGGREQDALAYLEPALDHLEGRYRNGAAADLARRALEAEGLLRGRARFDLLLRLHGRLDLLGRRTEERSVLEEALATAGDDTLLRARAHRALGSHYYFQADYERARQERVAGHGRQSVAGSAQGSRPPISAATGR